MSCSDSQQPAHPGRGRVRSCTDFSISTTWACCLADGNSLIIEKTTSHSIARNVPHKNIGIGKFKALIAKVLKNCPCSCRWNWLQIKVDPQSLGRHSVPKSAYMQNRSFSCAESALFNAELFWIGLNRKLRKHRPYRLFNTFFHLFVRPVLVQNPHRSTFPYIAVLFGVEGFKR